MHQRNRSPFVFNRLVSQSDCCPKTLKNKPKRFLTFSGLTPVSEQCSFLVLMELEGNVISESSRFLTFNGDAGRYRRLPLPMATPGDADLVADVVTRLTEEMDGALCEEALTRGWIAAEPSMFWHQRVRAVAQPACRNIRVLWGFGESL